MSRHLRVGYQRRCRRVMGVPGSECSRVGAPPEATGGDPRPALRVTPRVHGACDYALSRAVDRGRYRSILERACSSLASREDLRYYL